MFHEPDVGGGSLHGIKLIGSTASTWSAALLPIIPVRARKILFELTCFILHLQPTSCQERDLHCCQLRIPKIQPLRPVTTKLNLYAAFGALALNI
jgi:hypothetical protein